MAEQTRTWKVAAGILLITAGAALLAFICTNATCTPAITNATNNQTGAAMYVYPNYGDTVNFSVEANETITTWTWYADGYDQFNNLAYLRIPYTVFGYHNVSVSGTNANGNTGNTTWIVWASRELRATHAENVDETAYDMIQESIAGEPSFQGLMQAVSHPYTQALGLIFYLFLFGLPLLMMYIRQDSMTIPATLMFIIGGVIIAMLPSQWQIIAGALMGLALFGMLYKLYKERG